MGNMKTTKKTKLESEFLKAIKSSRLNVNQISRASGIDTAQLYHFINGKRSLILSTAGKLADVLGMELVKKNKPVKPQIRQEAVGK
jgi:plasmid maintenance system antidote protein VapI